jgi:hypothetical protein
MYKHFFYILNYCQVYKEIVWLLFQQMGYIKQIILEDILEHRSLSFVLKKKCKTSCLFSANLICMYMCNVYLKSCCKLRFTLD